MRKLVLAVVGATALAIGTAGNATVTVDACSMVCDGPTTVGSVTTIGYTDSNLANPTFTEWVTFSNDLAGTYAITLDTSSIGVDFTSAVLTGPGGPYNLSQLVDVGPVEFWALANLFLDVGQYTLTINGNNSATGALGGTITINSVPEPGTWAMMLIGFGAVGYAVRRRRKSAMIPQIA